LTHLRTSKETDMNHTERPCAAHGWTSYRYAGRYGTIMIGGTTTRTPTRTHGGRRTGRSYRVKTN